MTIYGGEVIADNGKGESEGAGIGGGYDGAGGTITVLGGKVTAVGGSDGDGGAGIGGGDDGAGCTLTVSGGVTEAPSGIFTMVEPIIGENMEVTGSFNKAAYIKIAEKGPTCEGGEIAPGEGGVWVVTPNGNSTKVAITGLPAGATVVVPPTVTKVTGAEDGKIIVKSGAVDITGAFTITGGMLALNPAGKVTIGKEEIQVTPTIGDLDDGEPFTRGEGSVAVMVKAIPGLKYVLVRAETVEGCRQDGGRTVVKSVTAKGARVTLSDDKPPKGQAFYWVVVSVP